MGQIFAYGCRYYATAATVALEAVIAVPPRANFIPGSDTQPSEKSSLQYVCRESH